MKPHQHKLIYFFATQDRERVKIGKTLNLDRRTRDLGRLSSDKLDLVAKIDGYTAVESWFHHQFRESYTGHGEWFKLEGRLAETIVAIRNGATAAQLCPAEFAIDQQPDPPKAPKAAPDPTTPKEPGKRERVALVRQLLESGATREKIIDWCGQLHAANPQLGVPAKIWAVRPATAARYIVEAEAEQQADDARPREVKRASNRADIARLYQMAISKGRFDWALKAKDMLCHIDGSYETAGGLGTTTPISVEDAVARIQHANSTLALAQARGVLPAGTPGLPVIDVPPLEDEEIEIDVDDAPAQDGSN